MGSRKTDVSEHSFAKPAKVQYLSLTVLLLHRQKTFSNLDTAYRQTLSQEQQDAFPFICECLHVGLAQIRYMLGCPKFGTGGQSILVGRPINKMQGAGSR